jgi:hypothetical protein
MSSRGDADTVMRTLSEPLMECSRRFVSGMSQL